MKKIGFQVTVNVGVEYFDKLSSETQEEVLNSFQNEIAKMINNTSEMTFLGGTGSYLNGV